MLVDQQQGIELALAESGDTRREPRIRIAGARSTNLARVMAICEIAHHQHNWLFTGKDEFRQSANLNCPATAFCYLMFANYLPGRL